MWSPEVALALLWTQDQDNFLFDRKLAELPARSVAQGSCLSKRVIAHHQILNHDMQSLGVDTWDVHVSDNYQGC